MKERFNTSREIKIDEIVCRISRNKISTRLKHLIIEMIVQSTEKKCLPSSPLLNEDEISFRNVLIDYFTGTFLCISFIMTQFLLYANRRKRFKIHTSFVLHSVRIIIVLFW